MLACSILFGFYFFTPGEKKTEQGGISTTPLINAAVYAGSASCRDCHAQEFQLFTNSHHALAERPVDPQSDARFFAPSQSVKHGTQTSEFRKGADGRFELATLGKTFPLERVVGVDPLLQFLVRTGNGRFQVTELAADPKRKDWFDIFGCENRLPGEWGHWTGRGMNWNNMCAACHNTALQKNYDEQTDSYSTTMVEAGVGCEACHGPLREHAWWQQQHPRQKNDPALKRVGRDAMLDTCGSCHSRRAELTGRFQPGDAFFDHYSLTIPDETDIYYPDGQIRDEDYEFASFLSSKMHAAGVRCVDCHEPHSGKTRETGNALCMRCHGTPIAPAPKIDPASHSHHTADEPGGRCVDCHMAQTTYMQRHARRDHGFIIPDPLMTKRWGVPNACNRCHTDKTTDWALQAVDKWYGTKMDRFTRKRTQVIAEAKTEKATADNLLALLKEEKHPYWRAVETGLLKRWASAPRVTGALLGAAGNTNALVRNMVVRALEPMAGQQVPAIHDVLRQLIDDPSRSVRIEAAWALHGSIDTNSVAGTELLHYLRQNCDQPAGALQLGSFYFDRDEASKAITWFRRAVEWDKNSAPFHHALAVSLSVTGSAQEAVKEMQEACRLSPQDAEYQFKLGLALNEIGDVRGAAAAMEKAVQIDANYAQAWYNLGLAYSALNEPQLAIEKLTHAESVNPSSARYPYARATILSRLGRPQEAREALQRALQIDPSFGDAAEMLKTIDAKAER